jgi:hypothetical protein
MQSGEKGDGVCGGCVEEKIHGETHPRKKSFAYEKVSPTPNMALHIVQ